MRVCRRKRFACEFDKYEFLTARLFYSMFWKDHKNANRESNGTVVLQYVSSQSVTARGFYSMFCSWWTNPTEVPKGDRSRSGRKVVDPKTTDNTKVVHFGWVSGRQPGRGPGQSPEAARDEVGGRSSRKPAKTSASRRRRTRRQDGDDDAQNDNGDKEVDDLARRPFFTRRARCPEVALGYRLGRLLILLISPPVRHKLSPGRDRHRRCGRDRWNRRADVVGSTIVTISEKH